MKNHSKILKINISLTRILFVGLLTIIASCSSFRKLDGERIKGDYKVFDIVRDDNKSNVVCIVYDKKHNVPITGAILQVNELKVSGLTNSNGIFVLNIPVGNFTISVLNVGNTTINTDLIKFKPNIKLQIIFHMGSTNIN